MVDSGKFTALYQMHELLLSPEIKMNHSYVGRYQFPET
jgi:hypothetical protein